MQLEKEGNVNGVFKRQRIQSIDILRGMIMILMTLDHTRDFLMVPGPSPVNMKSTTVALFFTRWITHFCAPTFVFLSGVSAFLAGQRRSKKELSRFLFQRGLWLILSDLLFISFLFTFDPGYHVLVLEVLWAIGCGMVLLSLLVQAPPAVAAGFGILIVIGHNLLDHTHFAANDPVTGITVFLTAAGTIIPAGPGRIIAQLYSVLPWSAGLFLGYASGRWYEKSFPGEKRRKVLLISGLLLSSLFVTLRIINGYGDPSPWAGQRNFWHSVLSFLNATKQPPSLIYFCMTMGPVLIFLSFSERFKGRFSEICLVYGNVPYFYFILHIVFLRILNLVLIPLQGLPYKGTGDLLVWQAQGFGYPLWAIYLYWAGTLFILYFPCRWFGRYKQTHRQRWLSYL